MGIRFLGRVENHARENRRKEAEYVLLTDAAFVLY